MKLITRWEKLNSVVFENMYGDRIHVGGMLILYKNKNVHRIYGLEPYYKIALARMGGNVKRSLMYIAEFSRRCKCQN